MIRKISHVNPKVSRSKFAAVSTLHDGFCCENNIKNPTFVVLVQMLVCNNNLAEPGLLKQQGPSGEARVLADDRKLRSTVTNPRCVSRLMPGIWYGKLQ